MLPGRCLRALNQDHLPHPGRGTRRGHIQCADSSAPRVGSEQILLLRTSAWGHGYGSYAARPVPGIQGPSYSGYERLPPAVGMQLSHSELGKGTL